MHRMVVDAFANTFGYFAWNGGLLTDELRAPLNGLTLEALQKDSLLRRRVDEHIMWPPGWWNVTSRDISWRASTTDARRLPERLDPRDTAPDEPDKAAESGSYFPYFDGRRYRQLILEEGYLQMQGTRAYASTALARFTAAPPTSMTSTAVDAYRGELYALDGYAKLLLADFFCSGVPLNTFAGVPVVRRFPFTEVAKASPASGTGLAGVAYKHALTAHQVVYHPSSTTAQTYRAALATFDTALRLAHDSPRVLNLARVGRGRAWLALGEYDSAAAAVAAVPQNFAYVVRTWRNTDLDDDEVVATQADREGINGLPYISSGDPRTAPVWTPSDKALWAEQMPHRLWPDSERSHLDNQPESWRKDYSYMNHRFYYPFIRRFPFTLADGDEAVLIRAEAALQHTLHAHVKRGAETAWLQLLNQLRATAPIPGMDHPNPAKLPPLKDPGTEHGRIALLFAERAYWLFLTGHRQGDLRRLVREYHWPQDHVYPTGPYVVPQGVVGQVGQYGTDVNLPIPPQERANPYFHGCLNRGA